jgi:uncharacterized membrane protein
MVEDYGLMWMVVMVKMMVIAIMVVVMVVVMIIVVMMVVIILVMIVIIMIGGSYIIPGITNSGMSFRISDLLRNILLDFDRRSVVGVGVECFRYGSSVGTFFRFHTRLATNDKTMMITPKARPIKEATKAK